MVIVSHTGQYLSSKSCLPSNRTYVADSPKISLGCLFSNIV